MLRDGTEGHVVVAYNVEGAPPDWYIDVYDSNDPFNYQGNENTPDGSLHEAQFQASRIHVGSGGNWSLPSTNISGDMTGLVVADPASLFYSTMVTSPSGLVNVIFGSAGPVARASPGRRRARSPRSLTSPATRSSTPTETSTPTPRPGSTARRSRRLSAARRAGSPPRPPRR